MKVTKRYVEGEVVHEISYQAPVALSTRVCTECGKTCGEEEFCGCGKGTVCIVDHLRHMKNWGFRRKGKLDITHIKGLYDQLITKGFSLGITIKGSALNFDGGVIDCDHRGNPEIIVEEGD